MSGVEITAGYRQQWGQIQQGVQTAFAAAAIRTCELPSIHPMASAYGIQTTSMKDIQMNTGMEPTKGTRYPKDFTDGKPGHVSTVVVSGTVCNMATMLM